MTNTSELERKIKVFDEKLKSFLNSLNIFVTTTLIFFLLVFLPYATLVGNAVELRRSDILTEHKSEINRNAAGDPLELFLNFREKACHYDIAMLSKEWLTKHKYPNNQDKKNPEEIKKDLDELKKRVDFLKLPLIDKIPASIGEIIIFSPVVISIYFALLILQFRELEKLKRSCSNLTKNHSDLPYSRITFLAILSFLVYIYIVVMLNVTSNSLYGKCNLLKILKAELLYQQKDIFYEIFHLIGFIIFTLSVIFYLLFKSE